VFAAPRDVVLDAARTYFTESLGWKISDTADGFTGEGYSFMHRSIANFAIQPAAAGTKVVIDLQVERAGGAGFMLFDVGGYYTIQIRKWFDGIQWFVHQKQTGQDSSAGPPLTAHNKTTACVFNGCLAFIIVMFGLWLLVNLICAIAGLITGNLYLLGRGGTIELHGSWARILSAAILALGLFIVWKMRAKRTQRIM
jgi:hypothetical protein